MHACRVKIAGSRGIIIIGIELSSYILLPNPCIYYIIGEALVTCDRQSVCPGDTLTCFCATGNSSALAWMINGTKQEFTSNDPLLISRGVLGSSGSAVLIENSDRSGMRVITSNLTLLVSMDFRDSSIILTCENIDRTMSEPVIIPVLGGPGKHC